MNTPETDATIKFYTCPKCESILLDITTQEIATWGNGCAQCADCGHRKEFPLEGAPEWFHILARRLETDSNHKRLLLKSIRAVIRYHSKVLHYEQTGADPNGFAYAKIPDWAIKQIMDDIELAVGE